MCRALFAGSLQGGPLRITSACGFFAGVRLCARYKSRKSIGPGLRSRSDAAILVTVLAATSILLSDCYAPVQKYSRTTGLHIWQASCSCRFYVLTFLNIRQFLQLSSRRSRPVASNARCEHLLGIHRHYNCGRTSTYPVYDMEDSQRCIERVSSSHQHADRGRACIGTRTSTAPVQPCARGRPALRMCEPLASESIPSLRRPNQGCRTCPIARTYLSPLQRTERNWPI